MNQRIHAIALALVLGLTACAASQTGSPMASPSTPTPLASTEETQEPTSAPSASAVPTPEPATSSDATFSLLRAEAPAGFEPATSCEGPIGPSDPVAIVRLVGPPDAPGPMVLRDYADPTNPRTVCTIGEQIEQLIDARHIVVTDCSDASGCLHAVVDLPQVVYHWFRLPRDSQTTSQLVGISPGLDEVAWISGRTDGTGRNLHRTTAGGDSIVAQLMPVLGRCGTADDSKQGAYAHSGNGFYVMDVPIAQDTVFIAFVDGQEALSLRPPDGGWTLETVPIMPVWSPAGETLFYQQAGDVWRWTASGGAEVFIQNLHWRYPTISPDGRYLAYAAVRDDGLHDVYLVDLAAGSDPQRIGRGRTTPVFLNDTQLWYVTEGQGFCGPGADEPLVYSLTDGSESPSIIGHVRAVWPATSSNY